MLTSLQAFLALGTGIVAVVIVFNKTICPSYTYTTLALIWLILYTISYRGAGYIIHIISLCGKRIDVSYFLKWIDAFQLLSAKFQQNKTLTSRERIQQMLTVIRDVVKNYEQTKQSTLKRKKYDGFNPVAERNKITSMVQRDFIKSWFTLLSSSGVWLNTAQDSLDILFESIFDRAAGLDIKLIARKGIKLYQEHISEIQAAQQFWDRQPKYRKKGRSETEEFKKIKSLSDAYNKLGKFHPALVENRKYEVQYVRSMCELIVSQLCSSELHKCEELMELVIDIVTNCVFEIVIELISQPHWIHKMLIRILSEDDEIVKDEKDLSSHNNEINTEFTDIDVNYGISDSEATGDQYLEQEQGIDVLSEKFSAIKNEIRQISHSPSNSIGGDAAEYSPAERNSEDNLRRCFSDSNLPLLPPNSLTFSSTVGSLNTLSGVNSSVQNESSPRSSQFYLPPAQTQCETSSFSNLVSNSQNDLRVMRNAQSNVVTAGNGSSSLFYVNRESQSNANETDNAQSSTGRGGRMPLFYLDETERNADSIQIMNDEIAYEHTPSSVIPYSGSSSIDGAPELLFIHVDIPKTDICIESRGNGRFVLYNIQYKAWHYNQSEKTWQSRVDIVGRRYREFVTLHSRLDDITLYKKHIKGIKGPKKWLSLPFGSLEPKLIESRRIFLEEYLQKLIQLQDVCNSFAVREFLAYEGDARIAFVRKATDRIDKMIVKGVSDMFTRISSALPNVHPGMIHKTTWGPEPRTGRAVDVSNWTDPHAFTVHYEDKEFVQEWTRGAETILTDYIGQIEYLMVGYDSEEEQDTNSDKEEFQDVIDFPLLLPLAKSGAVEDDIPLSSAVLDLAVTLYGDRRAWFNQKKTINITKMFVGKLLERYFEKELSILASPGFCGFCLNQLKEAIWPGGSLSEEEPTQLSNKEKEDLKMECRQTIIKFLPGFLSGLFGDEEYNIIIDEVMKSVDNEIINRNFIFHILDVLLQTLFPEIEVATVQRQFINT